MARQVIADFGLQVPRPLLRLRDRRSRDEELPLGLPFEQHQPVQPDVADKHAVRQVAAALLLAERHPALEGLAPHDRQPHRLRLARPNPQRRHAVLDRQMDRRHHLRRLLSRKRHVAERPGRLGDVYACPVRLRHGRGRGDLDLAKRLLRRRRPRLDVQVQVGLRLLWLDDDLLRHRDAVGHIGDAEADRAGKVVDAINLQRDLAAGAGAERLLGPVGRADRRPEVRRAGTQFQLVRHAGVAEAAGVGNPNLVRPIGRGGERELGVAAAAVGRVVVVAVVKPDDRQPGPGDLGARRMRPHDVGRLAERVGHGRGVEQRGAAADARVQLVPVVRPRRILPELHDLAAGEEQIVQLHLVPVVDAEVVVLGRVLPAEREVRIADRLEHDPFDRLACGGANLDDGVDLGPLGLRLGGGVLCVFLGGRLHHRLAIGVELRDVRRPGPDDPLLAGLRLERVRVDLGRLGDRAAEDDRLRQRPVDLGLIAAGPLAGRRSRQRRVDAGDLTLRRRRALRQRERRGLPVHQPDDDLPVAGDRQRRGHIGQPFVGRELPQLAGVPHLHRPVGRCGHDERPAAGQMRDRPFVREPRQLQRVDLRSVLGDELPAANAVVGPGGEHVPVAS